MAVAGGILLVVVIAYYGVGRYGASKLDTLNAELEAAPALPQPQTEQPAIHGALMPDGSFKPIHSVASGVSATSRFTPANGATSAYSAEESTHPRPSTEARLAAMASDSRSAPPPIDAPAPPEPANDAASVDDAAPDGGNLVYTYNAIYPGYQMHPKHWGNPWAAGADDYAYGATRRLDGYLSLDSSQGMPRGEAPNASRIVIPSINVDSAIEDLGIIDLGDSRAYETPMHIVGRIPQTSNPGELGNTWLFGHLESPVRGEGNVFQRLPEIPALLNSGDPVYVSVLNEDGDEYLYQATASNVVHKEELHLYDSDDSTITLVACVPRLVYDHRILITAKLVGVKRAEERRL